MRTSRRASAGDRDRIECGSTGTLAPHVRKRSVGSGSRMRSTNSRAQKSPHESCGDHQNDQSLRYWKLAPQMSFSRSLDMALLVLSPLRQSRLSPVSPFASSPPPVSLRLISPPASFASRQSPSPVSPPPVSPPVLPRNHPPPTITTTGNGSNPNHATPAWRHSGAVTIPRVRPAPPIRSQPEQRRQRDHSTARPRIRTRRHAIAPVRLAACATPAPALVATPKRRRAKPSRSRRHARRHARKHQHSRNTHRLVPVVRKWPHVLKARR
jgi:hypothetical protein